MITEDEWAKLKENERYGIYAKIMMDIAIMKRQQAEFREYYDEELKKMRKDLGNHIIPKFDRCPHTDV